MQETKSILPLQKVYSSYIQNVTAYSLLTCLTLHVRNKDELICYMLMIQLTTVNISDYTAPNVRMTGERWIRRDIKGRECGLIEVLCGDLIGWTLQNDEKFYPRQPGSWPRSKAGIFRIQARTVTAWTQATQLTVCSQHPFSAWRQAQYCQQWDQNATVHAQISMA